MTSPPPLAPAFSLFVSDSLHSFSSAYPSSNIYVSLANSPTSTLYLVDCPSFNPSILLLDPFSSFRKFLSTSQNSFRLPVYSVTNINEINVADASLRQPVDISDCFPGKASTHEFFLVGTDIPNSYIICEQPLFASPSDLHTSSNSSAPILVTRSSPPSGESNNLVIEFIRLALGPSYAGQNLSDVTSFDQVDHWDSLSHLLFHSRVEEYIGRKLIFDHSLSLSNYQEILTSAF